ncbi:MAG: histidinol-phosphate aminotransferase family protein [Candidatus Syntrophoarchaeum sp. WYZ-LMO15]|nr:MAG: histidinol-phosphate aminotransferase family protein [Candidatus Syntrophoarchaeum sp. WYZ-LMO15]
MILACSIFPRYRFIKQKLLHSDGAGMMGAGLIREEIRGIRPCKHGGGVEGVRLDFSVSLNPLGPPPSIAASLRRFASDPAGLIHYPDSDSSNPCNVIAQSRGVLKEEVLVGNGASELLFMIPLISIEKGDVALIPSPSYGEYGRTVIMMGGQVCYHQLSRANNFRMDIESFKREIEVIKPKIVFLCNPNNPTGEYLGREDVLEIVESCKQTGSFLVIDEAYADLSLKRWYSDDLIRYGNVIIVRSLTKSFACAGIRIGYLIADKGVISALKSVKIPWNVNALAQKVVVSLIDGIEYLNRSVRLIEREKAYLFGELKRLSLTPFESDANYILVDLHGRSAASINEKLLEEGIYIRDCASFGLPEFARIGIRRHEDNVELVNALKKILEVF